MPLDSEERGCLCKVPYRYRSHAVYVLEQMRKKARDPKTLAVYECQWCKKWHIGNDKRLRSKPDSVQTSA